MINVSTAGVRKFRNGLLLVFTLLCGMTCLGIDPVGAAQDDERDLFERPYVYLIRGDDKFGMLATNYTHTVPSPDSMISVEHRPLERKGSDTTAAAPQRVSIALRRPMTIRLVFVDSVGTPLAAYEFANVPAGGYSLGVKPWPQHLQGLIAGRRGLSIDLAADQKYQGRLIFDVDANYQLTNPRRGRIPDKPQSPLPDRRSTD